MFMPRPVPSMFLFFSSSTRWNALDDINSRIDEYNSIVSKLEEFGVTEYATRQHVQFIEQADEKGYDNYAIELAKQFDEIVSQINEVSDRLYNIIDEEEYVWEIDRSQTAPVDIDQEQFDRFLMLEEACRELDALIPMAPVKKAMTDEDKNVVRKLYQAIMDAQVALDDYLRSDKESGLDVSPEIEVIASAMEKLAENTEAFGSMSVFVQRWWLTNFSEQAPTNTSETVIGEFNTMSHYFQKIKQWIDTLKDHVLRDLYNHPKLQEWYSTLLNEYFTKLVDNFEAFLAANPEADRTSASRALIEEARQFIQIFNTSYRVSPIPQLTGEAQSDLEAIENISVTWQDHYNISESHSPAYMDMKEGGKGAYAFMSQKPDFITTYMTQDENIESDPNHTTRFTFRIDKDGKVKLLVQYWDKQNNKARYCHLGFENDIKAAQQNPNVSQELLDWLIHYNMSSISFTNKVKALLNFVSKNPEYKITFNVTTNKGSIQYDKNRKSHNVTRATASSCAVVRPTAI